MGSTRIEKTELYPAKLVPAIVAIPWEGHQVERKALAVGCDGFPVFEEDPQREIQLLLNSFLSAAARRDAYKLDPGKFPSGRPLLEGDPRWRGRVVMAAAARAVWFWKAAPQWDKEWKSWVYEDQGEREPLLPLLSTLFGMELELTEEEVIELARLLSGPQGEDLAEYIPPLGVVLAIERVFAGSPNLKRFQKELLALLQFLLANASSKESVAQNRRSWRSLGATEALERMDDPNAACLRLGQLLLNDTVLITLLRELDFDSWNMGPLSTLLDLLEPWAANHPLSAEARSGVAKIQKRLEGCRLHKTQQRELGRLRALLGETSAEEIEPGEAWANQARQDLAALDPGSRTAWNRLIAHCLTAEASKPAKKWLTTAGELVEAIGQDAFKQALIKWFPLVALPRPIHRAPPHPTWSPDPDLLITDRNALILKGLAWCCAGVSGPEVSRALADLAETCFKKVRWLGPRCPRAGNACLYSLSVAATQDAAAQLSRLDQTIKQPTAKKLIGKSLNQAAALTGRTREELEETVVPTYGLDAQGILRTGFGEFTAEFRLHNGSETELLWSKGAGKPQKSVPAEVKNAHGPAFKQFQRNLKDIEKMLAAQRIRLERLFLAEREWDLSSWQQRYLNHPLLAPLTRRLIWHFRLGDRTALAMWHAGKLVDVTDRPLDWLAPEAKVRLWHPIGFEPATVLAWRQWLETHQVTQPFKQAHRELYLLTEAELKTRTYSNRFAAHIIRQHQFVALAKQRGWQSALMGSFDFQSTPTLTLPHWKLAVEFWVNPAEGGRETTTEMGIWLYLSTDQVRFCNLEGRVRPLTEVPALVFSEVMRDIDLFVSVGSIGNDPNWRDTGGNREWDAYWQSYSFGDLSATAQTRHEVLERLLPRLKIASRCRLTDKFLSVQGSLRTYKIHLGSGNILMEPNDQYLCIVPDRSPQPREQVLLPFEGDHTLSVILSKAFLLAEDAKIKDPTILQQIQPSK